jgi:sarcosine oxidase subunit beta
VDRLTDKKIDECDITVIGGGVIGCFIAYYLSKAGKDVVLLERGDIGAGASGANDACIMAQSKKPGPKLALAIESSYALWGTLAEELHYDIEYVRKGSMLVIEREDEVDFIREFSQAQKEFGLDVVFLNTKETRELQPAISPHILAATYCPLDGEVNPFYLLVALVNGARRSGGRVYTHTPVKGFELDGDRITHVLTAKGMVKTSVVVCAAGAYAPDIGNMLGIEIPIRPRRGQVLITEAIPPLIGPYMMSAKGVAAKFSAVSLSGKAQKPEQFSLGMIISQTVNGNMVLASTYEFAGYDTTTTIRGLTSIAKYTSTVIPALKDLKVIRSFSGLRPFTEDGVPIVGPTGKIPNFIIAAGHEGDGVAVAPATGREVSEKLVRGEWPGC